MKSLTKFLIEGTDLEGKCADVIVLNTDGDILLLRRPETDKLFPGKWCVPGGHRQDDETIEYAAKRECFEESGIRLTNICSLFPWTYPDGFQTHFFYAIVPSNTKITLSDEHSTYVWQNPRLLPNTQLSGTMLEPLQKALDIIKQHKIAAENS